MDFLSSWIVETWSIVLAAGPWLMFGFLLAGVIYVLIPVDQITRHLGKPGLGSVVKAALFGAPLPLCSCSVIPVASSIRQQGASRGATTSFLISTPETGIDSISVSYALLGPFVAVIRPIAAIVTAVTAGWLTDHCAGPDDKKPAAPQQTSCCCHCPAADGNNPQAPTALLPSLTRSDPVAILPVAVAKSGLIDKFIMALRHGYISMFRNLAHWLLLGFTLAGLVSALVPSEFLSQHVGQGLPAMLLMTVVGLPMYVCATSSTPLAAALIAKGLSPGAALVFLLVGPATNITTMVVVARDLGYKALILYIATIAIVAILFGWATDAIFSSSLVLRKSIHACGHDHPGPLSWICAMALVLLIANGLRLRMTKARQQK